MTSKDAADNSNVFKLLINIGTVLGVILAIAGTMTYGQGQLRNLEEKLVTHTIVPMHNGAAMADVVMRKDIEINSMRIDNIEEDITEQLSVLLERSKPSWQKKITQVPLISSK